MVRLLDFNPNKNEVFDDSKLSTMIALDVCYGCTPDLPKLRYSGPQDVFIWDDLKSPVAMNKKLGVKNDLDFVIDHYNIYTKQSFLPFENWTKTAGEPEFFLPTNPHWINDCFNEDVKAMEDVDPLPVQGRVITCNLKTLRALDNYYRNTEMFFRILQPVVGVGAKYEKWVWVYFNRITQFTKYDPHERKHRLFGGIRPRTIRRVASAGHTAFEVDAYNRPYQKVG